MGRGKDVNNLTKVISVGLVLAVAAFSGCSCTGDNNQNATEAQTKATVTEAATETETVETEPETESAAPETEAQTEEVTDETAAPTDEETNPVSNDDESKYEPKSDEWYQYLALKYFGLQDDPDSYAVVEETVETPKGVSYMRVRVYNSSTGDGDPVFVNDSGEVVNLSTLKLIIAEG